MDSGGVGQRPVLPAARGSSPVRLPNNSAVAAIAADRLRADGGAGWVLSSVVSSVPARCASSGRSPTVCAANRTIRQRRRAFGGSGPANISSAIRPAAAGWAENRVNNARADRASATTSAGTSLSNLARTSTASAGRRSDHRVRLASLSPTIARSSGSRILAAATVSDASASSGRPASAWASARVTAAAGPSS